MPSACMEVGRAFNLGMTADEVLVALSLAGRGEEDEVAASVCSAAAELLEEMEEGCTLFRKGGFSAAPDFVRRVGLYDFAARATRRAYSQEADLELLQQIKAPLVRISNHEPPGDVRLAQGFFSALASLSTEDMNHVLERNPWRGGIGRGL